jgi:hypothetical protein
MSIDRNLVNRYRFFREHGGYCTPPGPVACALELARAERAADALGWRVEWRDDDLPWDGDGPAPRYLYAAILCDDTGAVLESLGAIGVNDPGDPYLRVVEAELASEAIAVRKAHFAADCRTLARL